MVLHQDRHPCHLVAEPGWVDEPGHAVAGGVVGLSAEAGLLLAPDLIGGNLGNLAEPRAQPCIRCLEHDQDFCSSLDLFLCSLAIFSGGDQVFDAVVLVVLVTDLVLPLLCVVPVLCAVELVLLLPVEGVGSGGCVRGPR